MDRKELMNYLKIQSNVYHFNFKQFHQKSRFEVLLEHISRYSKINDLTPPSWLAKKVQEAQKILKEKDPQQDWEEIDVREFLQYLEEKKIWNAKESLKKRMKLHMDSQFGYQKIKQILLQEQYSEDDVIESLIQLPAGFWLERAKMIATRIMEEDGGKSSVTKLARKIRQKLHYLGFRDEEVESTIAELFNE